MSSVLNGYIPDTFTAIFSLPLIDRGENKIQSTSIGDKNENYITTSNHRPVFNYSRCMRNEARTLESCKATDKFTIET